MHASVYHTMSYSSAGSIPDRQSPGQSPTYPGIAGRRFSTHTEQFEFTGLARVADPSPNRAASDPPMSRARLNHRPAECRPDRSVNSSSRFIDITFHKIYTYTDMGEEFSSKNIRKHLETYI